jgi:hypothetical protein
MPRAASLIPAAARGFAGITTFAMKLLKRLTMLAETLQTVAM